MAAMKKREELSSACEERADAESAAAAEEERRARERLGALEDVLRSLKVGRKKQQQQNQQTLPHRARSDFAQNPH